MKEKLSKEEIGNKKTTKIKDKEDTKKIKQKNNETTKNNKVEEDIKNTLVDGSKKVEEKAQKVQYNNQEKNENEKLKILKPQQIIPKEELEKIKKEIRNETSIPKEKRNELYKMMFENILFAIAILIYFIFIDIGYMLIKKQNFEITLKVSSMVFVICTIGIFEYAYKKESGKYTIKGIEMLLISITTLIIMQIYKFYNNKLINSITILALAFSIYYIVKSIIIYIKYKKNIKKQANNIYRTTKRKEVK